MSDDHIAASFEFIELDRLSEVLREHPEKRVVILIRHGESIYNETPLACRLIRLCRDSELSARGVSQAYAVRETLSFLQPDLVLVSPLRRAKSFAAIVFSRANAELMEVSLHSEWQVAPVDVPLNSPRSGLSLRDLFLKNFGRRRVYWEGARAQKGLFWLVRLLQNFAMTAIGSEVETETELLRRVKLFEGFLNQRGERVIIIVGHGRFFARFLKGRHLDNAQIAIRVREV